MAKADEQKFYSTVTEEGKSKTRRARVPSGVLNTVGAKKGDLVEFTVKGVTITGARIMDGTTKIAGTIKESVLSKQSLGTKPEKPAAKAKPKVAAKAKPAANGSAKAKPKKVAKKTDVAFELPAPKKVVRKVAKKK